MASNEPYDIIHKHNIEAKGVYLVLLDMLNKEVINQNHDRKLHLGSIAIPSFFNGHTNFRSMQF